MQPSKAIVARILAAALALGFFVLNIWAFSGAPFHGPGDILTVPTQALGQIIPSHRWATVILADLMLGWVLSSILIIYTERRLAVALLWIFFVFGIGNFVTALYFIVRLPRIKAALIGARDLG